MHTHQINLYQMYLARATAFLVALCALCVFLYAIFLLMAVVHTAARTQAERQASAITAKLGDMEMAYLSDEKALTPDYAKELGFVEPAQVSAVYTSASQPALTINTNR